MLRLSLLHARLRAPISMLAVAAGMVLAATGCRPDQRAARIENNTAVINIGADPSSLDPAQCTEVNASKAVQCLMRGLTSLDHELNPVPALAESWEVSNNGQTWTFKLREAYWSNGEPITAEDFIYSWKERVLNPELASQYAYQLFYIKGAEDYYNDPSLGMDSIGVRAPSPDTLEVELIGPTPFFAQLVAHHTYFPVCKSVVEEDPNWYLSPETYVESGPFVMTEFLPGSRIELVRNDQFYDAEKVGLDGLTLRMIENESTELIAYENGELDATYTLPAQDIPGLSEREDYHSSLQVATYFVAINTTRPPLDNPKVRLALALASPRQEIVEHVTQGGQIPALTLSPPQLYKGGLPETPMSDANYEMARQLLAEAGYPNGEGMRPLGYLYNTMEGHRKIAQVLQETWRRELGITLQLENQEFKVAVARRRAGDYDLSRAGWTADFGDPLNFLEMFDSVSENNDPKFYNDEYDRMLEAIRTEGDQEKRMDMMREAEAFLLERSPIIPLYFYTQSYMVAPRFVGYRLDPMGFFEPVKLRWAEAEASPEAEAEGEGA